MSDIYFVIVDNTEGRGQLDMSCEKPCIVTSNWVKVTRIICFFDWNESASIHIYGVKDIFPCTLFCTRFPGLQKKRWPWQ